MQYYWAGTFVVMLKRSKRRKTNRECLKSIYSAMSLQEVCNLIKQMRFRRPFASSWIINYSCGNSVREAYNTLV